MTRSYKLGKRADQQAETHQRIVEAALDLHTRVGPAATTISMIADQAGVQRHTVYAHFPDELSLFMACSGLFAERDPMPGGDDWAAIPDPVERLKTGLLAVYEWFARNAQLMTSLTRDIEVHETVQKVVGLRIAPTLARWREVLGGELATEAQAVLGAALNFATWRALGLDAGMENGAAAEAMTRAILAQQAR